MKHYPIAILCYVLFLCSKQKEVKKNKIKTVTELITDYVGGKEVTRNDSYKKFNKQGEVLEEIEYDKTGNSSAKCFQSTMSLTIK
jgi:hypothetical protein